jgi:hypothetical protein
MPGQVLQVLNKILFDNEGSFKDSVLSDLQRKRFASAKRFASWLRLVPNNKLSGGRIISSKTPKGKNAIALALRQAANSIGNQKEPPSPHSSNESPIGKAETPPSLPQPESWRSLSEYGN